MPKQEIDFTEVDEITSGMTKIHDLLNGLNGRDIDIKNIDFVPNHLGPNRQFKDPKDMELLMKNPQIDMYLQSIVHKMEEALK